MDIADENDKLITINDPLDQASPKHMLNILNNDCIQEIVRRIENIEDFLTAAEVCTKFQENARQCFPPIYKVFYSLHRIRPDFKTNLMLPSNRVQSFLSIFGDLIEKIVWGHKADMLCELAPHHYMYRGYSRIDRIERGFEEDRQCDANDLRILIDACGKTVKELEINDRHIDFNVMQKFEALEKLTIWNCNGTYDVKVREPGLFSKLTQLTIRMFRDNCNNVWLQQTFPKLIWAYFRGFEHLLNNNTIVQLIKRNPQLQNLIAIDCMLVDSSFWEAFDDTPSLDLCILYIGHNFYHGIYNQKGIKRFGKCFANLKVFNIDICRLESAIAFINLLAENDTPIEELSMHCAEGPVDCAHAIQKLKHIKHLRIESVINQSVLLKLLRVPQLEILKIRLDDFYETNIIEALKYADNLSLIRIFVTNGVTISQYFYFELLKLTKNRVKLIIGSVCKKSTVLVDSSVLKKNEKWLEVFNKF